MGYAFQVGGVAVEGVGQGAGPKKKTLKRLGGRAPRAHPPPTSPSPQFVTLAGFHALNYSMFNLAKGYAESGMSAYVGLQQAEFGSEKDGYTATKHQREVGTGYFDLVTETVTSGTSSTLALAGSTEADQF